MKKIFLKSGIYALFTLFLLFFGNIFVNADDNGFQVPTQNGGQKQTGGQNQATNKENDISGEACTGNSSCLADKSFVLPVKDLVPGGTFSGGTTKSRVDNGLVTIIRKLMIPFGTLALFVMTIGGGYMVMSNGQDETLSKGKRIFRWGLISLSIALCSYVMVALLTFLLYAN
ncbi:hypothetical protein D8B46_09530 [Candidatus Gracilibacteria bacterium]|nr:MAG: hypothetical protein D8B46_09530 [Candidatus Gracilibacteria bacterium]